MRCAELAAASHDILHPGGALLHVGVASLEAVLLVCLPGAANDAMAAANIVRVDPASEGVALREVKQLSLDMSLTEAAVHISGIAQVRSFSRFCWLS